MIERGDFRLGPRLLGTGEVEVQIGVTMGGNDHLSLLGASVGSSRVSRVL